jgi:hypothetical protein
LFDRLVRLGGVNQAGDRADAGVRQQTARTQPDGRQTQNGLHPAKGWWSCRGSGLQAADLAIAQRVVDQADQVTRRGGDSDVAAASLPNLVASSRPSVVASN